MGSPLSLVVVADITPMTTKMTTLLSVDTILKEDQSPCDLLLSAADADADADAAAVDDENNDNDTITTKPASPPVNAIATDIATTIATASNNNNNNDTTGNNNHASPRVPSAVTVAVAGDGDNDND